MSEKSKHCPHCTNAKNDHHPLNILKDRDPSEKKKLLSRCNRIEGQVRGVKKMIENDIYCDDILNQIAAARSALDSLSKVLLEHHMKSCLIHRVQSGDFEVIDELLTTIGKMTK